MGIGVAVARVLCMVSRRYLGTNSPLKKHLPILRGGINYLSIYCYKVLYNNPITFSKVRNLSNPWPFSGSSLSTDFIVFLGNTFDVHGTYIDFISLCYVRHRFYKISQNYYRLYPTSPSLDTPPISSFEVPQHFRRGFLCYYILSIIFS